MYGDIYGIYDFDHIIFVYFRGIIHCFAEIFGVQCPSLVIVMNFKIIESGKTFENV